MRYITIQMSAQTGSASSMNTVWKARGKGNTAWNVRRLSMSIITSASTTTVLLSRIVGMLE